MNNKEGARRRDCKLAKGHCLFCRKDLGHTFSGTEIMDGWLITDDGLLIYEPTSIIICPKCAIEIQNLIASLQSIFQGILQK